jgi:hypothetical protein
VCGAALFPRRSCPDTCSAASRVRQLLRSWVVRCHVGCGRTCLRLRCRTRGLEPAIWRFLRRLLLQRPRLLLRLRRPLWMQCRHRLMPATVQLTRVLLPQGHSFSTSCAGQHSNEHRRIMVLWLPVYQCHRRNSYHLHQPKPRRPRFFPLLFARRAP